MLGAGAHDDEGRHGQHAGLDEDLGRVQIPEHDVALGGRGEHRGEVEGELLIIDQVEVGHAQDEHHEAPEFGLAEHRERLDRGVGRGSFVRRFVRLDPGGEDHRNQQQAGGRGKEEVDPRVEIVEPSREEGGTGEAQRTPEPRAAIFEPVAAADPVDEGFQREAARDEGQAKIEAADRCAQEQVRPQQRRIDKGEEQAAQRYHRRDEDRDMTLQAEAVGQDAVERLAAHGCDEIGREDRAGLYAAQADWPLEPDRQEGHRPCLRKEEEV